MCFHLETSIWCASSFKKCLKGAPSIPNCKSFWLLRHNVYTIQNGASSNDLVIWSLLVYIYYYWDRSSPLLGSEDVRWHIDTLRSCRFILMHAGIYNTVWCSRNDGRLYSLGISPPVWYFQLRRYRTRGTSIVVYIPPVAMHAWHTAYTHSSDPQLHACKRSSARHTE
jgi:hypothetical protein